MHAFFALGLLLALQTSPVEGSSTPSRTTSAAPAAKKVAKRPVFKTQTPRDLSVPFKAPLVGGAVALVAGIPGLVTAMGLATGGLVSMTYILWRYMDWDKGELKFDSDLFVGSTESERDERGWEERFFQRVLWNGGRYALTGAVFLGMLSTVSILIGVGLLAGSALTLKE